MNNKLAIFIVAIVVNIVLLGLYQMYEEHKIQKNKYAEYKLGNVSNAFQSTPKNTSNYSFKIVTGEAPIMVIQNPYTDAYNSILDQNATIEMFNVGKDFRWKAITINFNHTKLRVIDPRTILYLENTTKLTWDRENNTVVIE